MLHNAITHMCQITSVSRLVGTVCANNTGSAARFYFGYWFSHWRA